MTLSTVTVTSTLMKIFLTALIMMRTICFMYSLMEIMKRRAFRKKYYDFSFVYPRHEILFAFYSILIYLHFIYCMYPLIIGGKYD